MDNYKFFLKLKIIYSLSFILGRPWNQVTKALIYCVQIWDKTLPAEQVARMPASCTGSAVWIKN